LRAPDGACRAGGHAVIGGLSGGTGGAVGAGTSNLTAPEVMSLLTDIGVPGKAYEPKYHSCATTECVRTGANLDMNDPATQAYVKALDAQVFKDIGEGTTLGSLVTPVGVPGQS